MKNIRFITDSENERVEIRARRKDNGKYDTFGFCHPATVKLIKQDGIKKHINLIILPPV